MIGVFVAVLSIILIIALYGWLNVLIPTNWNLGSFFWTLLIALATLHTFVAGMSKLQPTTSDITSQFLSLINIFGLIVTGSCVIYTIRLQKMVNFWLSTGLIIYIVTGFITIPWATEPAFQYNLVWGLGLSIASICISFFEAPISRLFNVTKYGLGLIIILSLVSMVVQPSTSLEPYSNSNIGINVRLYGVTVHPNTLGYLAATLLIITFYRPARQKLDWILRVAGFTALILAQSKTSWGGFALGLGLIATTRIQAIQNSFNKSIVYFISICSILLGIWFAINMVSIDDFDTTFTGRNAVWDQTLIEYETNPLFGYGPNLWSTDYALDHNLPWATQAHNQWIHTLGQSGIIGVVGLLLYVFILFLFSLKAAPKTDGVSLAIFGLIFLRCFTETPFRLIAFDLSILGTHLLLWLIISQPSFFRLKESDHIHSQKILVGSNYDTEY